MVCGEGVDPYGVLCYCAGSRGCREWLAGPPAGMAAVFVKWARDFFFMSGMMFLVRRWSGNQTDALG